MIEISQQLRAGAIMLLLNLFVPMMILVAATGGGAEEEVKEWIKDNGQSAFICGDAGANARKGR